MGVTRRAARPKFPISLTLRLTGGWPRRMLILSSLTTSTVLLLVSCGAVSAVAAHFDVLVSRSVERTTPHHGSFLLAQTTDVVGADTIERFVVAPLGSTTAAPPGAAALPSPGQCLVSRALYRLAASDAGLRSRYCGDHVTVLDASGTTGPGELVGYVGVRPCQMPSSDVRVAGSGFGGDGSEYTTARSAAVHRALLGLAAACVLVAMLAYAAFRHDASTRDARSGLLMLAGASPAQVARMYAVEGVVLSVISAATGWTLYGLATGVGGGLGAGGWRIASLRPGALSAVVTVAFLVTCWRFARALPRRARTRVGRRPRLVRGSLLASAGVAVAGIALIATAIARGSHVDGLDNVSALMTYIGVVGAVIGCLGAVAVTALLVARLMNRQIDDVAIMIGARQLEDAPWEAARSTLGPATAAIVVGFTLTFLSSVDHATTDQLQAMSAGPLGRQLVVTGLTGPSAPLKHLMKSSGRGDAVRLLRFTDITHRGRFIGQAVVGRCADLEHMVQQHVSGCRDDAPARLHWDDVDQVLPARSSVSSSYGDRHAFAAPVAELDVRDPRSPLWTQPLMFLPARPPAVLNGVTVLVESGSPADARRAISILTARYPGAQIDSVQLQAAESARAQEATRAPVRAACVGALVILMWVAALSWVGTLHRRSVQRVVLHELGASRGVIARTTLVLLGIPLVAAFLFSVTVELLLNAALFRVAGGAIRFQAASLLTMTGMWVAMGVALVVLAFQRPGHRRTWD